MSEGDSASRLQRRAELTSADPCGCGLATTLQLLPSQCSIKASCPCSTEDVLPTAHTLSGANAAISSSCVPFRSACRSGLDTMLQLLQSQCAISAASPLPRMVGEAKSRVCPTAQASVEESAATLIK